jgi:hypothetical protein
MELSHTIPGYTMFQVEEHSLGVSVSGINAAEEGCICFD